MTNSKNSDFSYTAKEKHLRGKLLEGVHSAWSRMPINVKEFEEIKQTVLISFHEMVVRGRECKGNIPLDSKFEPLRNSFGYGRNAAQRAYHATQKEWYDQSKQISLKQYENAYKSDDPTVLDFEYEQRDADEEAIRPFSEVPEEEKRKIRKKRKEKGSAPPVMIRPKRKFEQRDHPYIRTRLKKEKIQEIRAAMDDAFSQALDAYDAQQAKLFLKNEYSGKPIYDYIKRQPLIRFDENKGVNKPNENAFYLRTIWALVGDAAFEALARTLSGKTLKFPTVEQQLKAHQKHWIYTACKERDLHKERYTAPERKDAALEQDLVDIAEQVRDGFIKEQDSLKKELGISFIGEEEPAQLSGDRVSQIYAEEKQRHKEFEKAEMSPAEDQFGVTSRLILARLVHLGSVKLKQALFKIAGRARP